jgi:hypothetical protein
VHPIQFSAAGAGRRQTPHVFQADRAATAADTDNSNTESP